MKPITGLFAAAVLFSVVSGVGAAQAPGVDTGTTSLKFCVGNVQRVTAKLNSVRAALSAYYNDTEGAYPTALQQLVPKYLPAIPTIELCNVNNVIVHSPSQRVANVSGLSPTDAGGWAYVGNGPTNANWGMVFVNCVHTSPSHIPWYKY